MKKIIISLAISISFPSILAFSGEPLKGKTGEVLFREHCAICHPNGGNIINRSKTLHKKDLDANNIKTPEDIISKMRNPGPGMPKFGDNYIPDEEAKKNSRIYPSNF
ncbi:cytochrome C [Caldimicrobium thiodismutans]|uniref:Cytochrome C n=1 Tax=Caldimicrobium thiodismutans TaxID=1653476 RepID=A0A0U5AEQ6_9BACT|nr:c-type cytochrome [Caldimicrobium thiodismutans]BAU22492.1 cytochrome C [Caldimicrobium thiodismutans]